MDKQDIPEEKVVNEIIQNYQKEIGPIIPILQDLQNNFGYISEDALEIISEKLQQPLPHIYGIATFHSQFKLKMRGMEIPTADFTIKICSGSPCHVKGVSKIIERVEKNLGIKIGEFTPDNKFSFQLVECLGACGISPAIAINDEIYGNLTPDSTEELINRLKAKAEIKGIEEKVSKRKKDEK